MKILVIPMSILFAAAYGSYALIESIDYEGAILIPFFSASLAVLITILFYGAAEMEDWGIEQNFELILKNTVLYSALALIIFSIMTIIPLLFQFLLRIVF